MSDLRDPLDDLLADVPTYVVPDARAAWAAGARRRTRHRVVVGACVTVVVTLLAGAVVWLPRVVEPQPAGESVDAYPARLDHAYWSRALPDSAVGPVAGILNRVDERETYDEPLGWYVVSPSGRLWEIPAADPAYQPALSPDGRLLAYLDTGAGQSFEIRNLASDELAATGIVASLRSANAGNRAGSFKLSDQMPSYWSPDSSQLLVQVGPRGKVVLVRPDGRITGPIRTGIPAWSAGWVDTETLAWLRFHGDDGADGADVVLTDLDGEVVRTVTLDLPRGVELYGQWGGLVSADGSRIAVVSSDAPDTEVYTFSLSTGDQIGEPARGSIASVCTMSWAGDDLRVPLSGDAGVLLADAAGQPQVMADPRLGSRCSQWATSALEGDQRQGLGGHVFGTSDSWLSWHWREVSVVALTALAFLVGIVLLQRRRSRLGEQPPVP